MLISAGISSLLIVYLMLNSLYNNLSCFDDLITTQYHSNVPLLQSSLQTLPQLFISWKEGRFLFIGRININDWIVIYLLVFSTLVAIQLCCTIVLCHDYQVILLNLLWQLQSLLVAVWSRNIVIIFSHRICKLCQTSLLYIDFFEPASRCIRKLWPCCQSVSCWSVRSTVDLN